MILATRRGVVEHRTWAGEYIPARGHAGYRAGVEVTAESVAGVPAVTAAVRFAAQEVAGLTLEVWRGRGVDARRVEAGWQPRFLAGRPNAQQSRFDFWATVEESLSYRGNAYVWLVEDAGRVVSWWALHPDQVQPLWTRDAAGIEYRVNAGGGFVDPVGNGPKSYVLREEMLHIRGWGDGGSLVAPSPIQRHRDSLGAAVAKPRYEASFYQRDATGGLAVTFPEGVTADQAREWRDLISDTYEGPDQHGKTKIFGGGVSLTTIGLSHSDAQFVESTAMSVQEAARIFGVPASLLDGERGSEPLSPEHEMLRWLRFGLAPRLHRIEAALREHPALFGSGSRAYPRFATADVVRGDLATQETIDHQRIQDGRLLIDEWRASQGLAPLPDGAGMVPQVVPVGGAPNPNTAPAPAPDPVPEGDARARGVERGGVTTRVDIPSIVVHVPEQPAPVVNVAAPVVNVEPTPVTVNVEPTPVTVSVEAPDVTVEAPNVQVDAPVLVESPARRVTLERDSNGRLVAARVEDV